jgi:hypothetical protein
MYPARIAASSLKDRPFIRAFRSLAWAAASAQAWVAPAEPAFVAAEVAQPADDTAVGIAVSAPELADKPERAVAVRLADG